MTDHSAPGSRVPLSAGERVRAVRLLGEVTAERSIIDMEIDALTRFLQAAEDLQGLGYSVRPPIKKADARRRYERWHARMADRIRSLTGEVSSGV